MLETRETPARDRLLVAAAELRDRAAGREVSTRAICELAGVQAPTLYHHFGSKEGLLDAVVSHGFRQFLEANASRATDDDPIELIRRGWDIQVHFGVLHPQFYAHVYGRVEVGRHCGVLSEMELVILQALEPAARQGELLVAPAEAAAAIMAASSGVTLRLIANSDVSIDWALSARVRDYVLDGMTTNGQSQRARGKLATVASAAVTLAALLNDAPIQLTSAETTLMRQWLGRLSSP